MKNISYYNNSVVNGYYDIIFERKKGIQSAWHHIKFNYIKSKITKTNIHLDIGCGPGTFLGILKKKKYWDRCCSESNKICKRKILK